MLATGFTFNTKVTVAVVTVSLSETLMVVTPDVEGGAIFKERVPALPVAMLKDTAEAARTVVFDEVADKLKVARLPPTVKAILFTAAPTVVV